MADLDPEQVQITGTQLTFTATAVGGDTVPPGDATAVVFRNDDASPKTATIVVPGSLYGQAKPDIPVVVPAGETVAVGPLPRELRDTDGLIDITYSDVTSLFVAVVRI